MEHLNSDQINQLIEEGETTNPGWMQHIESCDRCRYKYESVLSIHHGLKQLEYQRPSMRFAKNIIELIEQRELADKSSLFWTRFTSRSLISAMALAVLMLVYMFFKTYPEMQIDAGMITRLSQVSIVTVTTIMTFWIIYLFDKWLGRQYQPGKNRAK